MDWLDYYNDIFIKKVKDFEELKQKNTNTETKCKNYIALFNSSCELIKLFLNYQGLFQYENREIIKEAFYVELIEDGERWINALSLSEIYKTEEKELFYPLILSYCEDDNFYIFYDLINKFEKLKDEYE